MSGDTPGINKIFAAGGADAWMGLDRIFKCLSENIFRQAFKYAGTVTENLLRV